MNSPVLLYCSPSVPPSPEGGDIGLFSRFGTWRGNSPKRRRRNINWPETEERKSTKMSLPPCLPCNRKLKQTTTATARRTSPNRRFNEQNNSCACALQIFVDFLAVLLVHVKWPSFGYVVKRVPRRLLLYFLLQLIV